MSRNKQTNNDEESEHMGSVASGGDLFSPWLNSVPKNGVVVDANQWKLIREEIDYMLSSFDQGVDGIDPFSLMASLGEMRCWLKAVESKNSEGVYRVVVVEEEVNNSKNNGGD